MPVSSAWNIRLQSAGLLCFVLPLSFLCLAALLTGCTAPPLLPPSPQAQQAEAAAAQGQQFYLAGNFRAALDPFKAALDYYLGSGDRQQAAILAGRIGWIYYSFARYPEAEEAFLLTLKLAAGLEDLTLQAKGSYALASVRYASGNLESARSLYQEALELIPSPGDAALRAECLSGLGTLFQAEGCYGRAEEHFKAALEINTGLGDKQAVAANLLELGGLYHLWGLAEKAREHYRQSRMLAREAGYTEIYARGLYLTAELLTLTGSFSAVEEFVNESLEIARSTLNYPLLISNLILEGRRKGLQGEYTAALQALQEARDLATITFNRLMFSRILHETGLIHLAQKQPLQARDLFSQALALDEEMGIRDQVGEDCYNLGLVSLELSSLQQAENWLRKALEIKEQLRLTATAYTRRDFLASEIKTYHALISAFIRGGKQEAAFDVSELISARYLGEELAGHPGGDGPDPAWRGITIFRQELDSRTAVLKVYYTATGEVLLLLASRQGVHTAQVSARPLQRACVGRLSSPAVSFLQNLRGIHTTPLQQILGEPGKQDQGYPLEYVISTYRSLLAQPRISREDSENLVFLGKALYNLLLEPLQPYLEGITRLCIVPGAAFSSLPIETLRLPGGRYCIEDYIILYAPSLCLLDIMKQRVYAEFNRPLLAFGGAEYNPGPGADPGKWPAVFKEALDAMGPEPGFSPFPAPGSWQNLPGSLEEVEQLAALLPGSMIYQGPEASESTLKELSSRGIPGEFRILHFATHALSLPAYPGLSCLVLSPERAGPGAEDGYLTMAEISSLDIGCEFVNLSACETALGKVYAGEGVVGLPQAFILAGAGSVAVSLWKVEDTATCDFMTGFYSLLQQQGFEYSRSLQAMKKKFIASEKYTAPFFWAPFVYYGP